MGRNIAICFFSGTGNTAAVARMLADELQTGNDVSLFRIEDIRRDGGEFRPELFDLIGIGYPSYGFNAPPIVQDFVKHLPQGGAGVFLFMTCAGPCYINDIAGYGLKKQLIRRGYTVVHEKIFCMPANLLIHYRDEIARQLVVTAQRRARTMAADLMAEKHCVRGDGVGAMLARALYVWCETLMLRFVSLDFRVKQSCNRCTKCVRNCPVGNIALKDGCIRFGTHCAACYRCVYGCPQRAIAGRVFNFAIHKDGYDIERIIRDSSINSDYITKDTKGVFSTLYKYMQEP